MLTAHILLLHATAVLFINRPAEIWEQVRTTAVPALTSSWRFWPLIHCVSFSNVIPKDLKLLFIDFMVSYSMHYTYFVMRITFSTCSTYALIKLSAPCKLEYAACKHIRACYTICTVRTCWLLTFCVWFFFVVCTTGDHMGDNLIISS